MRSQTPPLAPGKLTDDVTVHLVLNDFGKLGRAYVETDEAEAGEWTVVSKIISGEYTNPVRVAAFNIAEGWSRDVTEDIARAVIERERSENHFSNFAKEFVEKTLGESDEIVQ
jgi:hypothetical protein